KPCAACVPLTVTVKVPVALLPAEKTPMLVDPSTPLIVPDPSPEESLFQRVSVPSHVPVATALPLAPLVVPLTSHHRLAALARFVAETAITTGAASDAARSRIADLGCPRHFLDFGMMPSPRTACSTLPQHRE